MRKIGGLGLQMHMGIEEQTVESLATERNCVLPTKDDASFEWKICYKTEAQPVPTATRRGGTSL